MTERYTTPNAAPSWPQTRCYATALRRADRAINRMYDAALRPTGLTTTQFSLLSLINRAPDEVTLSNLADAQVMDRTTMSRNLNHLVHDGYIAVSHGEDRRKRTIRLTSKGLEAITQARPLWQKVQDRIESEQGLTHMTELLKELDSLSKIDQR